MNSTLYDEIDNKREAGISLIPFLVFSSICAAVLITSLKLSASTTRTTYATRLRSERYYEAESGLNTVVSWLRANSQSLVSPLTKDAFYSRFDRTAPAVGTNDTGPVQVPTKVKLKNTSNSAILTNSADLAIAAFPSASHIVSGAAFDAVNQFAGINTGNAMVRVTLVDALPLDPAKDAPPLASPDTDYYPVYRIDAVTGTDRGSHVYGYVTGNLYYIDIVGFYGRDYVDVRQDCMSASFTGATPGPYNAKCPVGSNGLISLQNNAEVYGSARTNGSISPVDHVCGDYPSCTTQGRTCQGATCNVPGLPVFQTWDQYCPPGSSHGNYSVPDNNSRILVTAGCYDTVTINNKGKLTLQTTTQPYFFRTLTVVGGNAATQLKVAPSPNTATVRLYVETVTGNIINGNQTINPSYKPSQLRVYYLGAAELKLNGNSPLAMAVVAPYAVVDIQGNSNFHGGVIAKALKFTGSATIVYDESLGGTNLNDLTLRLRNVEEGYK